MGRIMVRYDGPGGIYVIPDANLEVSRGETIVVSEALATRLASDPHDRFTVVGLVPDVAPEPMLFPPKEYLPLAPAIEGPVPKRRRASRRKA